MEALSYRTLYKGGSGEILEKKSRFIATFQTAGTEEEAMDFIAGMKKKYWDASHNCHAFVVGDKQQLHRCSDDGEPGGTAGRPMLEVLLKEGICNAAVVVTRYFGGTLLGTGGLVRAYQKAVQEGLKNSVIIEKHLGRILAVDTDYNGIGKLQYILAKQNIPILDTEYAECVRLQAVVPQLELESIQKEITEGTSGTAKMEAEQVVEFALMEGRLEIFEKK